MRALSLAQGSEYTQSHIHTSTYHHLSPLTLIMVGGGVVVDGALMVVEKGDPPNCGDDLDRDTIRVSDVTQETITEHTISLSGRSGLFSPSSSHCVSPFAHACVAWGVHTC